MYNFIYQSEGINMNNIKFLRSTKIVATVGTATDDVKQLKSLVEAGVNVFRLNFSHGNHGDHLKRITNINYHRAYWLFFSQKKFHFLSILKVE